LEIAGDVQPQLVEGAFVKINQDIQSLRAFAVSAVLLFHIWPAAFPGGFIGVDAFFVISGFLITRILADEFSSKNSIDFYRFYKKRAVRLFPAALSTLTVVFYWYIFLQKIFCMKRLSS